MNNHSKTLRLAVTCIAPLFLWSSIWAENAGSTYPNEWPNLSEAEDFCVDPGGTYSSLGLSNSSISEEFRRPIFERNFLGEPAIASEFNTFSVQSVPGQSRLAFVIRDSRGNILLEKDFGIEFQCQDGWVVYKTFVKGGSGESPHISSKTITRISRAIDGSLVINTVIESVSRKWVLSKKTSTSNIWYRYENATNPP